jgi:hypothetical protein
LLLLLFTFVHVLEHQGFFVHTWIGRVGIAKMERS